VVTATGTRWRHLAWLYPAATTVVVLASANHFVLDAAAGAAIMAAGLLATRCRASGRPPAGPLPGAARPVPEVSGAALADGPGGQHPPGTSRVVAAATAASSPPPHPQGDRHDHDQNAPAGEPPEAGHRAGRPADPGAAAGRRLAGRVPDPAGRPHRDRGDRPGRDADRAGDQHPAADHLHRRGLERPDPRPRRGRHWWALAIGHVPADASQPTVTFTRRTRHRPGAAPPDAVDGLWFAYDGLWVAAATGHHTLARLTMRSATRVRRLRPVTARPAATAQAHPTAR